MSLEGLPRKISAVYLRQPNNGAFFGDPIALATAPQSIPLVLAVGEVYIIPRVKNHKKYVSRISTRGSWAKYCVLSNSDILCSLLVRLILVRASNYVRGTRHFGMFF